MDALTAIIAIGAIGLFILWMRKKDEQTDNIPPGPRGWSSVAAQWRAMQSYSFHLLMSEWAHKYGAVIGLSVGSKKTVVVNDPDLAWEMYVTGPHSHTMVHRCDTFAGKYVFYGEKGAYFTKFDDAARQKFNLIKSYFDISGDRGVYRESVFDEELKNLCGQLKRFSGRDAPLHEMITASLKNMMYLIVTGERPKASMDQDKLYSFDRNLNHLVSAEMRTALEIFPSLRHFPGMFRKLWHEIQRTKKDAEEQAFYSEKSSYKPGNLRGLTDFILSCQERPQYHWMDDEHMCSLLLTVFTCSNVTTLGYLLALLLSLLHHPEVMTKIQREIDDVVGRDRQPLKTDRSKMPYSQATVLEIQRYACNLPLTSFRTTTRNMEFKSFGVEIPEGSQVLLNAWYIHHDERIFKDPWEFKPERFLDARGQLLSPTSPERKAVYGLGIGERMCPAAEFAACRLFLYMTNILQKFDISKPSDMDQWPSCDPRDYIPGAILQPKPFSCNIQIRAV